MYAIVVYIHNHFLTSMENNVVEGNIYTQDKNNGNQVWLNESNIDFGFLKIECPDCLGTGIFIISDDDQQFCNLCKTTGYLWASLI